jgi:hypothetical protein
MKPLRLDDGAGPRVVRGKSRGGLALRNFARPVDARLGSGPKRAFRTRRRANYGNPLKFQEK